MILVIHDFFGENWLICSVFASDIGRGLTCVTKYFHMKIEDCNLCKYEAQGLQETFVVLHH